MKAFTFVRPTTIEEASTAAAVKGSVIKAGGIDLLDRMKERVDEPDRVVNLGDVKFDMPPTISQIDQDYWKPLVFPANTTLAQIADSDLVRRLCPALADAAAMAASPQIRERATIVGNLMQHTRCGYYRHASFPCFKRGDAECPVLADGAVQDSAAVFANRPCASAHPSSLAPVLCAVGAEVTVMIEPKTEEKRIGFQRKVTELFTPPRRGVTADVDLGRGILVINVAVPGRQSIRCAYEEVRQKSAFDWALVSCCVRLDMNRDDVKDAGVWLGSVAPTPWHAEAAEKALVGKSLTDETIAAAADAAVVGATPLPGNAYKVDLVKVVVRRALERLRNMK